MELKEVYITDCPNCNAKLRFAQVAAVGRIPEGKRFKFICPECRAISKVDMTRDQLDRIKEFLSQNRVKPKAAKAHLNPLAEIGHMVAWFRNELDELESPEGVELVFNDWRYEQNYHWSSVPVEWDHRIPLEGERRASS